MLDLSRYFLELRPDLFQQSAIRVRGEEFVEPDGTEDETEPLARRCAARLFQQPKAELRPEGRAAHVKRARERAPGRRGLTTR